MSSMSIVLAVETQIRIPTFEKLWVLLNPLKALSGMRIVCIWDDPCWT
jgi:hypothetical protein